MTLALSKLASSLTRVVILAALTTASVAAQSEPYVSAHFAKRARSPMTNVELLQQLPPTFSWFVCGCTKPSGPDPGPGALGFAHGAQGWVLRFPPYDRQKSMP